jgi:hypothetical protein
MHNLLQATTQAPKPGNYSFTKDTTICGAHNTSLCPKTRILSQSGWIRAQVLLLRIPLLLLIFLWTYMLKHNSLILKMVE